VLVLPALQSAQLRPLRAQCPLPTETCPQLGGGTGIAGPHCKHRKECVIVCVCRLLVGQMLCSAETVPS
jgi:hypothetical protein